MPLVTNPVTRHLAVIASAIATLTELSAGRAVLGIGVGESAVRTIGLRPARLAELEAATETLRSLLAGEPTQLSETEITQTWRASPPAPIFYAASAPKSLRLAGRVADGVLFQVGADIRLVEYGLENIAAGLQERARNGGFEKILRLSCTVDHDREWAREQARGYAAAAAGTVYASVPADRMPPGLYGDLARMKARYDYRLHTRGDAQHASLISDTIIDAIGLSGTPDEVVLRLRELAAVGVDAFCITTADPASTMRILAEEVIPRV